jgi:phenylacetate-CoA ligase
MMITTNLINIAMPLINYRIGDVATEVPAEQAARYPAPAVARIDGRTDDFLIDSTGRRFGRLSVVVKTMSHIKEMQFYQDTAGRVDVRIVRDVGYQPADEQGVRDILRHYLGDHLTLNIVYVDRIERLPSGKFRLVLNKLPKA